MKMYTLSGEAVEIESKVEQGYLARPIYQQYEDDEDVVLGDIQFYETLYDVAPTPVLDKEIAQLTQRRDTLSLEISTLQAQRRNDEALLSKISKYPFLQGLVDYLTGNFEFFLMDRDLTIRPKSSMWHNEHVKVVNVKHGGWQIYKLQSEHYDSYDDQPINVFKTREEAVKASITKIVTRLAACEKFDHNTVRNLDEVMQKIDSSNEAKKSDEVVKAYEQISTRLKAKEAQKIAEKLKNDLAEYERKKELLEKLQP